LSGDGRLGVKEAAGDTGPKSSGVGREPNGFTHVVPHSNYSFEYLGK